MGNSCGHESRPERLPNSQSLATGPIARGVAELLGNAGHFVVIWRHVVVHGPRVNPREREKGKERASASAPWAAIVRNPLRLSIPVRASACLLQKTTEILINIHRYKKKTVKVTPGYIGRRY
jgi:hypothetical protein